MTKIKKAVIPAAGLGTRFLPYTKTQPKEMLPLLNKPTIHYVVEEAIASGIESIYIITSSGKDAIANYFDRTPEYIIEALKRKGDEKAIKSLERLSEIKIDYTKQIRQNGLGDALSYAEKWVGNEPFALLLGDDVILSEIPATKQLININEKYDLSVIAVEHIGRDRISSYGVVDPGVSKLRERIYCINDLVEKPEAKLAPSNLGIIGRYILTPAIFGCLKETRPGKNGELQLTDAMKLLLKIESMYAYEIRGRRLDLGSPASWLTANIDIGLRDPEISSELKRYLKTI